MRGGRYAHLKSHQKNVVSSLCEYFPSAVERVGMNLLGDSREAGLSASYTEDYNFFLNKW